MDVVTTLRKALLLAFAGKAGQVSLEGLPGLFPVLPVVGCHVGGRRGDVGPGFCPTGEHEEREIAEQPRSRGIITLAKQLFEIRSLRMVCRHSLPLLLFDLPLLCTGASFEMSQLVRM